MAHQSGEHNAFTEDQSRGLTTSCNSSSNGVKVFLSPCMPTCIYTYTDTHAHIINNKLCFKERNFKRLGQHMEHREEMNQIRKGHKVI